MAEINNIKELKCNKSGSTIRLIDRPRSKLKSICIIAAEFLGSRFILLYKLGCSYLI